jgi:formate-dependent nitrite reductase membrane component NrfD
MAIGLAWGGLFLLITAAVADDPEICLYAPWGYSVQVYLFVVGLSLLAASASYLYRLIGNKPMAFAPRTLAIEMYFSIVIGLSAFFGAQVAHLGPDATWLSVITAALAAKEYVTRKLGMLE